MVEFLRQAAWRFDAKFGMPLPGALPPSLGLPSVPHLSGLPTSSAPAPPILGTPGLPGAFQPKVRGGHFSSGLGPVAPPGSAPGGNGAPGSMQHAQLLLTLRDRDQKAAAAIHAAATAGQTAAASAQPGTSPAGNSQPKKSGKWCAAHVKIAWQIHMHQQKGNPDGGTPGLDGKPSEPLAPPSHLLGPGGPGSSLVGSLSVSSAGPLPPPHPGAGGPPALHRPEIGSAAALLAHAGAGAPPGRSPFEAAGLPPPGHAASVSAATASLLSAAQLGKPQGFPPFPRPSPYANLANLGQSPTAFGGLGSLNPYGTPSAAGRDPASVIPGLTSPHEWNRLHRTPPSFPQPPTTTWSKTEERDREADRDRAGSRDSRNREHEQADRERELREKERAARSPSREHERKNSIDERSRESHRSESRDERSERARSRSPLRQNGPIDLHNSMPSSHKSSREGSVHSNSPLQPPPPSVQSAEVKVKEERKEDIVIVGDEQKLKRSDSRNSLHRSDSRSDSLHRSDSVRSNENGSHLLGRTPVSSAAHPTANAFSAAEHLSAAHSREQAANRNDLLARTADPRLDLFHRDILSRQDLAAHGYPGLLQSPAHSMNSLLERARQPHFMSPLERHPHPLAHLGLPNHLDRALELDRVRMEMLRSSAEEVRARELERHRDQMLNHHAAAGHIAHSLSNPGAAGALALMQEQEKYRAELIMRDRLQAQGMLERERLVQMDRERAVQQELAERSKHLPPGLRPSAADMYLPHGYGVATSMYSSHHRPPNHSPMLNHNSSSKSNSPANGGMPPGVPPPPLIPSNSLGRSHSNSPTVSASTTATKAKPPSPLVSATAADKPALPSTNGHDADLQR